MMAKSYNRDFDVHTALFLIILIGGFAWSNQEIVSKVGHIIPVVLLGLCGLFILVKISKVVKWFSLWQHLRNPELAVIDKMTGLEFEKYVAKLLVKQGYKSVRLTEEYDFGIDIIAVKDGIRWGIQVKRHSGLVKAEAVRQVVTALRFYRCDRAMVITNSTFSRVAKRLAEINDCKLLDRNNL